MGHNIDLNWLLGIPDEVKCPRCRRMTPSELDEYDIDCGDPSADKEGIMNLDVHCGTCDCEFEIKIKINLIEE